MQNKELLLLACQYSVAESSPAIDAMALTTTTTTTLRGVCVGVCSDKANLVSIANLPGRELANSCLLWSHWRQSDRNSVTGKGTGRGSRQCSDDVVVAMQFLYRGWIEVHRTPCYRRWFIGNKFPLRSARRACDGVIRARRRGCSRTGTLAMGCQAEWGRRHGRGGSRWRWWFVGNCGYSNGIDITMNGWQESISVGNKSKEQWRALPPCGYREFQEGWSGGDVWDGESRDFQVPSDGIG